MNGRGAAQMERLSRCRTLPPRLTNMEDEIVTCECCWKDAGSRQHSGNHESKTSAYYAAMKDHEERGCVCSKQTIEGRIARAGDFWHDGRDTREEIATLTTEAEGSK